MAGVGIMAWLMGCGPSFLSVGQQYMQQNNPAMAVEYFDAGLQAFPGDKDLWNQYVMASLLNETRLRRGIKRLQNTGQNYMALDMMYALYASLERAKALHRGDAMPGAMKSGLKQAKRLAIRETMAEFENGIQAHQTRADLELVRKTLALDPGNELLKQRYENLLDMFKFYAAIRFDKKSALMPKGVLLLIAKRLGRVKHELIEPVNTGSDKYNADVVLYVGRPRKFDTGWVMVRRRAFHKWVPRRDYNGRIVYEKVRVCEEVGQDENGNPIMKCQIVRKEVYMPVRGELRFFQRHIEVDIVWKALLNQLGQHRVARAFTGTAIAGATSQYFVYRGNPLAREVPVGWASGRRRAQRLPSTDVLVRRALYGLAVKAAEKISKSIE